MKSKMIDMTEWMKSHNREHRKSDKQVWSEMFRNNRDSEIVQRNIDELFETRQLKPTKD